MKKVFFYYLTLLFFIREVKLYAIPVKNNGLEKLAVNQTFQDRLVLKIENEFIFASGLKELIDSYRLFFCLAPNSSLNSIFDKNFLFKDILAFDSKEYLNKFLKYELSLRYVYKLYRSYLKPAEIKKIKAKLKQMKASPCFKVYHFKDERIVHFFLMENFILNRYNIGQRSQKVLSNEFNSFMETISEQISYKIFE